LAKLGHKVMRLRRLAIGPVRLGHLKSGRARRLAPRELETLRTAASRRDKKTKVHV
jgi:23S rRNA pseudouridine2605 synthase